LLRRLPFSLTYCLLGLLPLLGFLVVASLLLNIFGGPAAAFYETTLLITGAYATTRVTLSIVQLMTAPHQPELRLMHIKQSTALLLSRWLGWIVVTAIFGAALADIAREMGANSDVQTTIAKLVGLIVHLLLLILIWRSRAITAAAIRGSARSSQGLSGLRNALADIWPFAATFFIVALWLLWSAGVDNGFQRLLHYFGWSAVVIIAASLLAIFILGAIDRSFIKQKHRQNGSDASAQTSGQSIYQLVVRRSVSIVIGACAFIVLLQVWGLDVQSWFEPGSVGRQLASALGTIAITLVLAFSAWESLNLTIDRRLERWTASGDTARATRLRTLVPILRTTLFIAIAMIVLLTALNQLGVNVAPLIAGAGIIGVALGFGSQKLVQDFITGIFLLMENAMQVGDSVTLAGLSGTVEYLSIRTVRLRAGDGSVHVIPFSSVTTVTNTNRGIGNVSISVSVSADTNIESVYAAINDVSSDMRADPKLKDLILADAEIWGVDQVNGATITIAGKIVTIDRARASVQRAFNARLLARFRELGIQFANPQQTWMVTEPVTDSNPLLHAAGSIGKPQNDEQR
jgi:small-conductance mechanosensitive channel